METAVNTSEQFVYQICRKSFLSFWSYLNPQGKSPGKELCDILVVCDPHILIISVKDVRYKDTGRVRVDSRRWERKAVDESVKQILGAQRWLDGASCPIRKDGTKGLPLPPKDRRVYHRIAIAFGADRKAGLSIAIGEPSSGEMVHVMDEQSCITLLRHLDTITDFTRYLTDKEGLFRRGVGVHMDGGEEDLLAVYLHGNRTFPKGNLLMLQENLWNSVCQKPEFLAKLREDKDSYVWDRLIEFLAIRPDAEDWEFDGSLPELELTLRTMAMEHRFSRRLLGKDLKDFLEQANAGKVRARCVQSMQGVTYVFLSSSPHEENAYRIAELGCRCHAAIGRFPDSKTIVGIDIARGTGIPGKRATNFCCIKAKKWTKADLARAKECQDKFGYFKSPVIHREHADEYPAQKVKRHA
jgi:hypothetical protein